MWIFVVNKPCPVDVLCGNRIATRVLSGEGTLKIRPGCSLRNGDIRIDSVSSKNVYASEFYIPKLNLPSITQNFSKLGADTNRKPAKSIFIKTSDNLELDQLSEKIRELKGQETLEETFSVHHVHHYIALYTLICTVASLAIIYKFRHKIFGQRNKVQKSIPTIDLEKIGSDPNDPKQPDPGPTGPKLRPTRPTTRPRKNVSWTLRENESTCDICARPEQ